MIANGDTPFCVGIESGEATGWPMTDWIEDFVLRRSGPEVFEQWVEPRDPVRLPAAGRRRASVYDLWSKDGAVFGGTQNIAATPFAEAGLPLLEGDCMMHRQGNFYSPTGPRAPTRHRR